jgi:FtsP/CotA-like multicopper oxidase with cupredoxin domain
MSSDRNRRDKHPSGLAISLDRRGFLMLGATVGAGLLLPDTIGCGPDTDPDPETPFNPELTTLDWVRSQDGVLDIEMTITATQVVVGSHVFMTRAYTDVKVNKGTASFENGGYTGKVPGPTLDVQPGDTIRLTLINKLPADGSAMDPTDCGISSGSSSSSTGGHSHGLPGMTNNTTNLHVHGLHVDPGPPGDDVLLAIPPGDPPYTFIIKLPKDEITMPDGTPVRHPAGTYWYHPHVHQSTAIQVFGGMAGAILIRDPESDDLDALFSPDPEPGQRQGKEQLLVVGEFMLQTCNGTTRLATYNEIVTDAEGTVDFFTINGEVNPVIRMHPSEVQRYRLIHAGFHLPLDIAFLRVPDDQVDRTTSLPRHEYKPFPYDCPTTKFDPDQHNAFEEARNALRAKSLPYVQVATDGITYAKPLQMPMANAVSEVEYLIGPGNRVDILAQFDKGTYLMVTLGYDLGFACSEPQALATIIVEGDPDTSIQIPTTMKTPALYPGFDDTSKPENQIVNTRTLEFKGHVDKGATSTAGYHFSIDGKEFCESRVDQCVALGAGEEWTINNIQDGGTLHPFHIHVNSFLVTSINGKTPSNAIWRDTLLLPKDGDGTNGLAGTFTFRSRFLHYTGKYVLHCHMLQHEDLGMMQIVDVEDGAMCGPPPPDDACPPPL